MTPGILKQSVLTLSCRQIGSLKNFISANISHECLSDQHIFYIFTLIFPSILIFGIILPILIIILIKKNLKNQLKL